MEYHLIRLEAGTALYGEILQGSKESQGRAGEPSPLAGEANWAGGTLRGPPA
jgi:hypothetical protein